MKGPWTSYRSVLMSVSIGALAFITGCPGGDNETPASFDPKEIALTRVEPADEESAVSRNRVVRLTFNTTVLPNSVHDQSIRVRTGGTFQTRPDGSFLISGNIIEFDPTVTSTGGENAAGFEAGAQVLIEVPLFVGGSSEPANNFIQNVEGNPITIASGDANITFTTGSGWEDPVPGPPGVLRLEFTPGADSGGLVPARAAVTVVFSEPIDPASVILGKNLFLTNNTPTAPVAVFQKDIPSITFFDGSLTRYTFLPVFGFGQGPFNILVNFIDPDAPDTFSPTFLPTDLAGNRVQNFTFFESFDTQFDPSEVNTGLLREDFRDQGQLDNVPAGTTDAIWTIDPDVPFALVSPIITTRVVNANITAFKTISGATTAIDNGPDEWDYCPTANPLVGPDLPVNVGNPPTSQGRRQMNLYRQGELGAAGTVIRAAWGPDSDATFAATYPDVIVRLGHKVKATGLANTTFFAQFDVDGFVTVVDQKKYTVPQAFDINAGATNDGYLDWPSFNNFFDFNGVDDMIIDIEAKEGNTFQTFRTFIAVTQIFGVCSCFNFAGCSPNNSAGLRQADTVYGSDDLNPSPVPLTVANPSPFMHVMQFELAKLKSDGQSLWYNTGSDDPDYLAPIINPIVQPGGATIEITWSGSLDGVIEDIPFTPNIDFVDGFQYIRFHIVLFANIFTGGRARVQLIELPFTFP